MSDEPKGGAEWPDAGDATPAAPPAGWQSPPAAVYGLEHSLRCPACKDEIDQLFVIRLLRTRANFMSSSPRSGLLLA